jgi:hypothetical protein
MIRLLFFLCANAHAMHNEYSLSLLAWSEDGSAALFERSDRGPEGGGMLAYLVVADDGSAHTFVASRDFSPGGGDRASWQKVSVADCKKRMSALAGRLRSFKGVSVRADKCEGVHREPVVVSATARAAAQKSIGSAKILKNQLELDGKSLKLEGAPAANGEIARSPKLAIVLSDDGQLNGLVALPALRYVPLKISY